jgi:hypothetical protein
MVHCVCCSAKKEKTMKLTKARLKRIIKEEIDAVTQSGPFPSLESIEILDRTGGREMPDDVADWFESTPGLREKFTDIVRADGGPAGMARALAMILDAYDNDPRAEKRGVHPWAVAYERLANGVGDLIRIALKEDGLDPGIIRDAIADAFTKELGHDQESRLK